MTFNGRNLVQLSDRDLAAVRWKNMSVVMQSAMNALNPVTSVGEQFKDAMRAHGVTSSEEIQPALGRGAARWWASTRSTSRAIRISSPAACGSER